MAVQLEILTPTGVVFNDAVDEVVVPSAVGEVGILDGHQPLTGLLLIGLLKFRRGNAWESMAVDQGFFFLQSDRLTLLTDQAVDVKGIDAGAAEEARKKAEKMLAEAREKQLDAEEIKMLEAKVKYQLLKQQSARR